MSSSRLYREKTGQITLYSAEAPSCSPASCSPLPSSPSCDVGSPSPSGVPSLWTRFCLFISCFFCLINSFFLFSLLYTPFLFAKIPPFNQISSCRPGDLNSVIRKITVAHADQQSMQRKTRPLNTKVIPVRPTVFFISASAACSVYHTCARREIAGQTIPSPSLCRPPVFAAFPRSSHIPCRGDRSCLW
jgi:hypothetical protein